MEGLLAASIPKKHTIFSPARLLTTVPPEAYVEFDFAEDLHTMALFELQPREDELSKLADGYWEQAFEKERQLEREAFEAGAAIRGGEHTQVNLEAIVRWKAERALSYLIGNSHQKIKDTLAIVADPNTPLRTSVEALTKLRGIDITVATAILSAIHPDLYAVLDFRALEALGHARHNVEFYQQYVDYLRLMARNLEIKPQAGMPGPTPLHALERALWEWARRRNEAHKNQ